MKQMVALVICRIMPCLNYISLNYVTVQKGNPCLIYILCELI